MAMTKRELIQFMDELVELASEENKARAILVKEKFINDFEKSYEYEKEVQTEITELPPYYIVNQAATTSGRKLGSVDGIASYIAEMLSLETGPYFYIEYAGVHSINGTDFYEFRCYRA